MPPLTGSDYRNAKRKIYHNLRTSVQRKTRQTKNDWWLRKSEELRSYADQNKSRELFAATGKLYDPTNSGVRPVMAKNGSMCKDRQDSGINDRNT